ncbi:VARS [Mytilus coruscus]|uniref:valine--tRNA ligase n=1 Tax=Mytilus coruscus TaxID=42192 RepID=A0A6J7ZWG5_MYTCO|nr:VARS [Mytilus coruscus]
MSASWCRLKTNYLKFGIKLFKLPCNRNNLIFYSDTRLRALCSICNHNHIQYIQTVDSRFNPIRERLLLLRQISSSVNQDVPKKITHFEQDEYKKYFYEGATETGSKKDVTGPLPPAYSPSYVEAAWYSWWVKQGYFSPEYQRTLVEDCKDRKEKFIVCLPPPNVTGSLHLGHALTNSIQDAIVRWKRMQGVETVWIPGCDHAGIATQVVVEKQLTRNQNKTRFDVGREKFLEEVWKWKNEKGERIYEQMKLLGSSLDWNRACFTMDKKLSEAVIESFVRLYDEGLIYRSNRLVNWSCALQSTISDIEVDNVPIEGKTLLKVPGYDNKVEFGILTSFAYPVEGGGEIIVSTTRLETMLGDVAIAVHPHDNRYKHLHGKYVIHPILGDRLPIICDDFVDTEFGTGAVKITPAHDYTDFEVGQRHSLLFKTVINNNGRMENSGSQFNGIKRFDCRKELGKLLAEKGLLKGSDNHSMSIPVCSRSKDVIEPILMDQWYVKCDEMAKKAVQVVQNKELKLIPTMYENIWYDYLENARDWCVSRQLWWGHRIPAYKARVINQKDTESEWIIARNESEAMSKAVEILGTSAQNIELQQDEDVLDTWFSSGIFPFSVHGWPDKTADLQKYYPTNLLETGSDIIFFWVARMVIMGLKLTNQLPFNEVLLHGLLRDSHGRKMSKSLGNVIDPIDVINGISLQDLQKKLDSSGLDQNEIKTAKAAQIKEFPSGISEAGADALRFNLCSFDFKAQEINMNIKHVKSNRHFCNKIWQAFKFVQIHLGKDYKPVESYTISDEIDQWILSRLNHMVESCDTHFKTYDLQNVTRALHGFWLNDFCDVYLECIKPVFSNSSMDTSPTKRTLYTCVDTFLRAASPFMPFLTEELYQRLHICNDNRAESVCIASYPNAGEISQRRQDLEEVMDVIKSVGSNILSVSNEFNIKVKKMNVIVLVDNDELLQKLKSDNFLRTLKVISKTNAIMLKNKRESLPDGCTTTNINNDVQVHCQLKDIIDPAVEVTKLKEKMKKVEIKLEKLTKSKKSRKYENSVIVKDDKKEELQQQIKTIQSRIKQIEDL